MLQVFCGHELPVERNWSGAYREIESIRHVSRSRSDKARVLSTITCCICSRDPRQPREHLEGIAEVDAD